MASLRVKRGDTLIIEGTRTDADGDAVSLSGMSIASEMRRGALVETLTCAVVDSAAGTFRVTMTAAETAALSVGLWSADVEFTDSGGEVASTETFQIVIEEDITNAG